MSSKVLGRVESSSILPMVWGQPQAPPLVTMGAANGPVTAVDESERVDETSALRSRIRELQQRLESETSTAYQRGLREGDAKAKSTVVAELQSVIQRLGQAVADLAGIRPRLRREAESDVVKLSLAIARRVLRREMSVDPGSLQALVHIALQTLERQEICRVYVHPNQASGVKASLDAAGARVDVVPEITRPEGTLIFETNQGTLDASVNAQLDEIGRGLADRVNQS